MGKGIGGAVDRPFQGATDDWLTPPSVIEALGPFDLDPCASIAQPWQTADVQYTHDGLTRPWFGRVWCNPPYGPRTYLWLLRLAQHGDGIALTFARTETRGFFSSAWNHASGLLFLEGRLKFHHPITGEPANGNAGAPSVLVAYGDANVERLAISKIRGALVRNWERVP